MATKQEKEQDKEQRDQEREQEKQQEALAKSRAKSEEEGAINLEDADPAEAADEMSRRAAAHAEGGGPWPQDLLRKRYVGARLPADEEDAEAEAEESKGS